MSVHQLFPKTFEKTILIIDDDPSYCSQIKAWIQVSNPSYQIIDVSTGGEGLKMLKTEKIYLVLLDLGLPDMHGSDFLREKNKNRDISDIPTILVTAEKNDVVIQQCKNIGGFFYAYKYDNHLIESLTFMMRSTLDYYDKCLKIQATECHINSQLCRFRIQ